MKFRIALTSSLALALVAGAGLGLRAVAAQHEATMRATLHGLNEVPPTVSRATATLRASVDETAKKITFTLTFRNLTAPPTAAHIHFGPEKVNGGVVVFFCGGGGKPACPTTTSGTITGTIVAADIVGPTAQGIQAGDFTSLMYATRTGNAYANIHSPNFPNGEIRGQISGSGFSRSDGGASY